MRADAQRERIKPDESTTGRHIPALDGLRGLAILMVLACHLLASNPNVPGNMIVRFLARIHGDGWIGVDLFFVLSGFLITGILYDTLSDRFYLRNFYARRSLRIFPVYYGFLFLLMTISLFTHDRWYPGTAYVLTYTVSLVIPGVLVTYAKWLNINHLWSLAIEEQFYLVWPVLVLVLGTRRRIASAAICGIVFSILFRTYWVCFTNMSLHPYVVYSFTPCRLDGLCAGALLAVVMRTRVRPLLLRLAPAVLLCGALGLAAVRLKQGNLDWIGKPVLSVILPSLLAGTFAGLLASCLRPQTLLQRIFSTSWLRFFGRYSYGLYLFHYTLVQALLMPLREHLLQQHQSKAVALVVPATLTLLLSLAAAWLSFRYIETPFLLLKARFASRIAHPRLMELASSAPGDLTVIAAE